MKRGFTLIEVLVASLLLGMLVSMLTTLFSQSSIAWSSGTAMVADLNDSRREISGFQFDADTVLDRDGSSVQGVFAAGRTLNPRAVTKTGGNSLSSRFDNPSSWSDLGAGGGTGQSAAPGLGNGSLYAVGVTSWGPDGRKESWDDITTWPSEDE